MKFRGRNRWLVPSLGGILMCLGGQAHAASCLSAVNNKVVIPAGKTSKDNGIRSRSTYWPLGAVEVEFAACRNARTGRYEVAPNIIPMKIKNQTVNLKSVSQGPSTTYEVPFKQGQVPNFGHGLFFDGLTRLPLRHPKAVQQYAMRLRFMACAEKPLSLAQAGLQSVKAIASLPLPVSEVKALGLWAFTLAVPDPEKEYKCHTAGGAMNVVFSLGSNGKANFTQAGNPPKVSYSYRARKRILFDDFPVRVDVKLETLIPAQAI